jgi:hypothetical protein
MSAFAAQMDAVASDQIPFAIALGLTWTAKDVLAAEKRTIRQVFDRPTPFSVNAFQILPATKTTLVASVEQKAGAGSNNARHWFNPQVFGGPRVHKAFERHLIAVGAMPSDRFAMPTRVCPKDAYGNVRGSVYMQILSDVGAQAVDIWQNATINSRKRNKRERFFVMRAASGTPLAIAKRKGSYVTSYFMFVRRAPNYKKRFPFFEVGQSVGDVVSATNFRRAFAYALSTRRRRAA